MRNSLESGFSVFAVAASMGKSFESVRMKMLRLCLVEVERRMHGSSSSTTTSGEAASDGALSNEGSEESGVRSFCKHSLAVVLNSLRVSLFSKLDHTKAHPY